MPGPFSRSNIFMRPAATRAALVLATHDPTIAGRLNEQWPMQDGRLHVPVEAP